MLVKFCEWVIDNDQANLDQNAIGSHLQVEPTPKVRFLNVNKLFLKVVGSNPLQFHKL